MFFQTNLKPCWNLGFLVLAVGFTSIAFADEATYALVYRFQPGQFSHYESEDRAEMLMQNAGVQDKEGRPLESKSIQQTQMLKSFRVVSVDENGGAILEHIVEKVRMASQSGDRAAISYDSTNGETPPKEFEKIAGTLGRPLARFHVAPNGRLLKVTMLVTDVPKNFSDAAAKADPVINFLVVMPEKPVKIGDKWSEKFDMLVSVGNGLNQTIGMIKNFELLKVTENVATIRARTSILTPTSDPEILRQLALMTPSGTIEFDMKLGRVLNKTMQFDEKVLGAFGQQTLLQARGDLVEKMVSSNPASRVATGAPSPLPK